MNIQGAIKACSKRKNLFARPRTWGKKGEAVDLGRATVTEKICRVQALSGGALLTSAWYVSAPDLICLWELVSLTDLVKEVKKLDARKNRKARPS